MMAFFPRQHRLHHSLARITITICFLLLLFPGLTAATECLRQDLISNGETIDLEERTYHFSGSCVTWGDGGASAINLHYDGTGVWNRATQKATETVTSPYGTHRRSFHCTFDPWLEPQAQCSMPATGWWPIASDYSASTEFPVAFMHINNFKMAPVSTLIYNSDQRYDLIEKVISRSVRVIDPVQFRHYNSPPEFITVEMERPVESPPNYAVVIKVEENGWPVPGQESRAFSMVKAYVTSGQKMFAYFNIGDRDLWGGSWRAMAHFVSKDPFWSPPVPFEVGQAPPSTQDSAGISQPHIINPRNNHAYQIEARVPLEITYSKDATIHYRLGYKSAAQADFTMLPERVDTANEGDPTGQIHGEIAALALLAGAELVDIKVEAWCTRTETNSIGWTTTSTSEITEVISRVIVSQLAITSPQQGQVFGSPAQIKFTIPFIYPGIDYDLEDFLEVEMEYAPLATNPVNPQASAVAFAPYANGSYAVTSINKTLHIDYQCPDMGTYRLRARIAIPACEDHPSLTTLWTEWRLVRVKGLLGSPPVQESSSYAMKISPVQKTPLPGQLQPKPVVSTLGNATDSDSTPLPTFAKPSLRTLPVTLLVPRESQKFEQTGPIQLKINGITNDKELDWQLEYKPFDQPRFSAAPLRGLHLSASPHAAAGSLHITAEGEYRLRFRSKTGNESWSKWRHFTVGAPAIQQVKPAGATSMSRMLTTGKDLTPETQQPEKPEITAPVKPSSTISTIPVTPREQPSRIIRRSN